MLLVGSQEGRLVCKKSFCPFPVITKVLLPIYNRIIIGSDRRSETKQGIEGKIVRFRLGRREGLEFGIGLRLGIIDCRSEPDRRSEAINFGTC